MEKLGKRRSGQIDAKQTRGYCGCRCSCTPLNFSQNAKNAAPSWIAASLTEPMGG